MSSQVALSFILLIGTGLLLRTILHLDGMDTGLDTKNVLSLDIPRFAANRQGAEQTAAVETLLQQVSELPGVESSGVATRVPLRGGQLPQLEFAIEGRDWDASKPNPRADYRTVSPGYFETVGMKLVAGRVFDGRDRGDGDKVAVINESMAKKYFQDQDPLGRRIAWSGEVLRFIGLSGDWRQIVGVVSDVRDNGPTADPGDVIYQPISQEGAAWALFVRTATPPQALAQPISEAIRRIEAGQPIENIATLEEVRADAISPQRLNVKLLGAFAVVALLIAAVGVAGVLSFSVSVRRRELGIRASLGADRSKLLRGVIREGILLAAGGLVVGAFGAWALTRFLRDAAVRRRAHRSGDVRRGRGGAGAGGGRGVVPAGVERRQDRSGDGVAGGVTAEARELLWRRGVANRPGRCGAPRPRSLRSRPACRRSARRSTASSSRACRA